MMAVNMFDAVNAVRRVIEPKGGKIGNSKRYPQRPVVEAVGVTQLPVDGAIEITVTTEGLRRRVHAARINGCTVYWE